MRISLIISLVLAVLAVVFALQNSVPIRVEFGPFLVESPTALILILTFLIGVTVGVLATLPSSLKRWRKTHMLQKLLTRHEQEIESPLDVEASPPAMPVPHKEPPPADSDDTRP